MIKQTDWYFIAWMQTCPKSRTASHEIFLSVETVSTLLYAPKKPQLLSFEDILVFLIAY